MSSNTEEEKEYIVYFYDGRVRRMTGKLSDLQKLPAEKIEEASLVDKILPMPVTEGPPLPRLFNIHWPGR